MEQAGNASNSTQSNLDVKVPMIQITGDQYATFNSPEDLFRHAQLDKIPATVHDYFAVKDWKDQRWRKVLKSAFNTRCDAAKLEDFFDGLPDLSNVLPICANDPSLRVLTEEEDLLYPYYMMMETTAAADIITGRRDVKEMDRALKVYGEMLKTIVKSNFLDLTSLENLLHIGRFLWTATYKYQQSDVEKVVRLAFGKLCVGPAGLKYFEGAKIVLATHALALCSLRYAVSVISFNVASELVASYMQYLTFVSAPRDDILTSYFIEPVMNEAAARAMNTTGMLGRMIAHLRQSFTSGVADVGEAGEVAARIMLTCAWDAAAMADPRRKGYYTGPMLLSRYLESLLGADKIAQLPKFSESDLYQHGYVHFTQFARLDHPPTEQELEVLWTLGVAVICQSCNKAVDLMLPVLVSQYTKDAEMFNSTENRVDYRRMTFVTVQVKNYTKGTLSEINKATEECIPADFDAKYPHAAALGCVAIGMSVQADPGAGECKVFCPIDGRIKAGFALLGISPELYPCLKGDVKVVYLDATENEMAPVVEELRKLVVCRRDARTLMSKLDNSVTSEQLKANAVQLATNAPLITYLRDVADRFEVAASNESADTSRNHMDTVYSDAANVEPMDDDIAIADEVCASSPSCGLTRFQRVRKANRDAQAEATVIQERTRMEARKRARTSETTGKSSPNKARRIILSLCIALICMLV